MKRSALVRFLSLGIAGFAAMLAVFARGEERTLASTNDASSEGGAIGGDIVYRFLMDDGTIEYAHIFTNSEESATFKVPDGSPIAGRALRLLAVGGGGSGGSDCGGGGGAGGVVQNDVFAFPVGEYSITVGAGGAAVAFADNTAPRGLNGGATAITNVANNAGLVLAYGGGGGGTSGNVAGLNGGSGGGGSGDSTSGAGGSGVSGQGYAGGTGAGSYAYGGAGGGGAGGVGGDASGGIGGTGGVGITSDITGESVMYAFGGGGRGSSSAGMSGDGIWNDGYGEPGNNGRVGQPGKPNTGAGGGGGGINTYRTSGAGGSGIVVIRYKIPDALGDDVTSGTADGQTFYKFGSDGTFTVRGAIKARVLTVGGGGAGGNFGDAFEDDGAGGGGGAGGMIDGTLYFSEGTYSIFVGDGGAANTTAGAQGKDGNPSYIYDAVADAQYFYAYGGGGGASAMYEARATGRDGGSGGGGTYYDGKVCAGGSSTQLEGGYGNAGGSGLVGMAGAGGGGAGGKGGDAETENQGGAGGAGLASNITGVNLYYACGGGGGALNGSGGSGGETGGSGAGGSATASAGSANTGSGGGGGNMTSPAGGAGGSGIVVIRIEAVRNAAFEKPATDLGNIVFDGTRDYCPYEEYDPTFQDIEGTVVTNAVGDYEFTVSLKPGLRWSDGTTNSVTCTWSVDRQELDVTGVAIAGWQQGEVPATPAVTSTPKLDSGWYCYDVSSDGGATWTEWTPGTALATGDYTLRLVVLENDNYTIPSSWPKLADGGYVPPSGTASFSVVEYDSALGFPDYLGYHVPFTVYNFPDYLNYHTVFTVTAANEIDGSLAGFPMLVRVSEATVPGIYSNTRSDLSDIRFTAYGHPETQLPFEIDTWNPAGESLIWVRVPEYKTGAQVVMSWGEVKDGEDNVADIPAKSSLSVWDDYAAVWHFGENIASADAATATSADSSGNGYTASPTCVSGSDMSVMVSQAAVFGNGRVSGAYSNPPGAAARLTWLNVADFDNSSLVGSPFTLSAWIKGTEYQGSPVIFAAKASNAASAAGWSVGLASSRSEVTVYGAGNTSGTAPISSAVLKNSGFIHVTVVYDGTTAQVYAQGATTGTHSKSVTISAPTAVTGLGLGGFTNLANITTDVPPFWGIFDEVRIRKSAVSEVWAKEEYAQAAGTCSPGKVFGPDDATLENFPMLVRVSDATIPGIYRTTQSDLSDIRFTLPGDPDTQLPFEIDTWNTAGESLIWVRVPEYKPGAQVVMNWGLLANADGSAKSVPDKSSESVWADYAGVWHFGEEIAATAAAATHSADSSGNGNDAEPTRYSTQGDFSVMVSTNGVFGSGRVAGAYKDGVNDYTSLRIPDFDNSQLVGSAFTWSGWISETRRTSAVIFSTKSGNASTTAGWEARMPSATSLTISGYGNATTASATISSASLTGAGFVHVTVVYNGTTVNVYSHGLDGSIGHHFATGTVAAPTATTGLAFGGNIGAGRTFWGAFDEVRVRKSAVTEDWAAEEFAQAAGTCIPGAIYTTQNAKFCNRWIEEPSAEPLSILAGEEISVSLGDGIYGFANMVWGFRTLTGTDLGQDSTQLEPGTYILVIQIPAGGDGEDGTRTWTGVEKRFTINVRDTQPTLRLGEAAEVTRIGRIFLANDDGNATQPVEGQGYYLTEDAVVGDNATYWAIKSEVDSPYSRLYPAVVSTLMCKSPVAEICGSQEIWRLEQVRIGNTYEIAGDGSVQPSEIQNYLPHSKTAKAISSASGATGSLAESAHLVMRNSESAVIYSPCYTNGIGTIYFDAVNGWTNHGDVSNEYCRIQVEVCRATSAGLIPTDKNVHSVTTITSADSDPVVSTNRYAKAVWEPVEMTAIKIVNDVIVSTTKTTELALDIETGGRVDSFYRVIVDKDVLGIREPARFRIRRTGVNPEQLGAPDGPNLILIDNIEVSPPPSKVDLMPYGNFDSSKGGAQVTGWSGAFETAFPSVTSGEIYGRMNAEFYTNYMADSSDGGTNMLKSATLFYRWRYLGQSYDPSNEDWKLVALLPDDGLRTFEPLDVPRAAGDIEFWSVAVQSAPYYVYCDYTGLDRGTPGYTEEINLVTNRCSDATVVTKTLGTDWFVRLRDGASSLERLQFTFIGVDGATNTYDAALVDDSTWRYYFKTLTNETGTVKFRMEGLNRQSDGAVEWATNNLYFAIDAGSVANNNGQGKLAASYREKTEFSDSDWYELDIDARTGYLLFQVDDAARSITVVHADYQNFNEWTDAAVNTSQKIFVGAFSEESGGPAVGTSSEKQTFDSVFSKWKDMPASNSLWRETFTDSTGINTNYMRTLTTPNGWTANFGKITYESYFDSGSAERALQMRGSGLGSIQYVASSAQPRGIDTLSFTTKLASSIDWDSIGYCDLDGMTAKKNYTFVSNVKMVTNDTVFTGASTASLVANYMPGKGCYEFRVVHSKPNGGTLQLWKWTKGRSGKAVQPYFLGSGTWSSNNMMSNSGLTRTGTGNLNLYARMAVSVSNEDDGSVKVVGFINQNSPVNITTAGSSEGGETQSSFVVEFTDNGTVGGPALTKGTVGVASANCPATFDRPRIYETPVVLSGGSAGTGDGGSQPGFVAYASAFNVTFPSAKTGEPIMALDTLTRDDETLLPYDTDDWCLAPGLMTVIDNNDKYGIRATAPSQTIGIFTAPGGTTNFGSDPVTNIVVSSFEAAPTTLQLRLVEDCSLQICVTDEENPAEVVIDNIELTQWRGEDWENLDSDVITGKPAQNATRYAYTNFTFTGCWVSDGAVLMSARRTSTNSLCSIVSPLMDGWEYTGGFKAGTGLGQISFRYRGAQPNAAVTVQVLTNGVTSTQGDAYDGAWEKGGEWVDVATFNDFEDDPIGVRSCYLGMRGVHGLVRLVIKDDLVREVADSTDPDAFGEITIESVTVRDEPDIDFRAWWGWNIRTLGDNGDTEKRMLLGDISETASGLSLAINNSVTEDTDSSDYATYIRHYPFVQTPTFGTNVVGGVSFKARKYLYTAGEASNYETLNARPAFVTLYGSYDGEENGTWYWLRDFEITSTQYTNVSYTTSSSETYKAFRFIVRGVSGVVESSELGEAGAGAKWDGGLPVRVLIDELAVTESVRPRVGFRNVGAFRSDMNGTEPVPGVPCESEQPLCKEGWGVQCEIYKAQLAELIDFESTNNPPRVYLHWYNGESNWGFSNWSANSHSVVELIRADMPEGATETNFIYRSSYQLNAEGRQSVVPESQIPGTLVQYMLEVRYNQFNDEGEIVPATNFLTAVDWQTPEWYRPLDYNAEKDSGFTAYTILDSVAPHWAWINEVNILGTTAEDGFSNTDSDCQYIEIAAPADADLTGWYLQLVALQGTEVITNRAAVFGGGGLSGTKDLRYADPNCNMIFHVIGSPASQEASGGQLKYSDGTLDGVWTVDGRATVYGRGEISIYYPIAAQLVRPRGILESEIVAVGTNFFANIGTDYAKQYEPEKTVENLNREMDGARFIFVGSDDNTLNDIITNSLSVVTNVGGSYACWTNETYECWTNGVGRTPGRININQVIEGTPPSPGGMSRIVFSSLAGDRIWQWDPDTQDWVTNDVALYVQRNYSTNILYKVANWHVLADAVWQATGSNTLHTAAAQKAPGANEWYVAVGTNINGNITVTAHADANEKATALIGENNRYREAILDWLANAESLAGVKWEDSDDLYLAEFRDLEGNFITQLNLTQMYWLDIPPMTNMWLQGGLTYFKYPYVRTALNGITLEEPLNNYLMEIKAFVTNANPESSWTVMADGRKDWSPYVLRGVKPGYTSWDWVDEGGVWSNVTFQVAGKKNNPLTLAAKDKYWVPLMRFVFDVNSFTDDHRSIIEIEDVTNENSPAYWEFKLLEGDFADETTTPETANPFFRWTLDDKMMPTTPMTLAPTNAMDGTTLEIE